MPQSRKVSRIFPHLNSKRNPAIFHQRCFSIKTLPCCFENKQSLQGCHTLSAIIRVVRSEVQDISLQLNSGPAILENDLVKWPYQPQIKDSHANQWSLAALVLTDSWWVTLICNLIFRWLLNSLSRSMRNESTSQFYLKTTVRAEIYTTCLSFPHGSNSSSYLHSLSMCDTLTHLLIGSYIYPFSRKSDCQYL